MKCNICEKNIQNNRAMSYHFRMIHKLDYIQYLIDNRLINIPKCLYCEENINILSGIGRSKILNHPEELKHCSNKCKLKCENYLKQMSEAGKKGGKTHRKMSKKFKEEKRKLMKNKWKNKEYKKMMSDSNKGKKKSEKHRQNISNGRKGMKFTEEHIDNISKAVSKSYLNGKYFATKIKYYSSKLNKSINFMSTYEFKFAIFLDSNDKVINWKYQPFVLKEEKLNKRYIPDFYVEFDNKEKWLVEIDRYKGFKEKYGYGWKIKLGEEYSIENKLTYKYIDLGDIKELFSKNRNLNFDKIDLSKQKLDYKMIIEKNLLEI